MQWVLPDSIHKQKYIPEMIVRGFEYFEKSRSCHKLLKNDYKLPTISTLTRLKSKFSYIEDSSFKRSVFQSLNYGENVFCWSMKT